MKIINFKKVFILLSVLVISINTTSCSKESITEELEKEGGSNNISPDNNSLNEKIITLENNFVLYKDYSLVNFILSTTNYNAFLEGKGDFKAISKKVYSHFKDDFDFIFILSVEDVMPDDLYYGVSEKVQNNILGNGLEKYSNTTNYGSEEKLKSVIYLPIPRFIKTGPFLHEIVHYWGNYGFISSTVGGHWGYSSVGGQLGGFDELLDLGNNSYQGKLNGENSFGGNANGGNTLAYGNTEMYLMGLIEESELQDIKIAENPKWVGNGKFTASSIKTITAKELVTANGKREPSYANSQKEFKGITVVISKESIKQENMENIKLDLDQFSLKESPTVWNEIFFNFWKATKGKATFDILLSNENLKE